VINDVLDLSKIESGHLNIEKIPFSIYSIAQDVYELFEAKVTTKGLGFHFDVEEKIPTLIGDPLRIKQVLLNFISNSVKFTAQGDINIHIYVTATPVGKKKVRIEVKDTGIGLTNEEQQKIFESFQQADASTTRKYGGTGLGLTISRSIAQLMDGEIGVDSKTGEGSTFWFEVTLDTSFDINPEQHNNSMRLSNLDYKSKFQESDAEILEEVDLEMLIEKLNCLNQLLNDNNLAAEDYFLQQKAYFDKVVPNCSNQLAAFISSCDYTSALVADRIEKSLKEKGLLNNDCC